MLYAAYEFAYASFAPARIAAGVGARFWRSPLNPVSASWLGRSTAAALDVFENATRRYPKPEWGIEKTTLNGFDIPVKIETAAAKSFCRLLHFKRHKEALRNARGSNDADPRVLIVAPMSGRPSSGPARGDAGVRAGHARSGRGRARPSPDRRGGEAG